MKTVQLIALFFLIILIYTYLHTELSKNGLLYYLDLDEDRKKRDRTYHETEKHEIRNNHNRNIVPWVGPWYRGTTFVDDIVNARRYDYSTLGDPLIAPRRRSDYLYTLPTVYTRGPPQQFRKMGTLIDESADNTDPYKFMILMGRKKYPDSSSVYEYYVTDNNDKSYLKFELPDISRELMGGETVEVKELNKTYKVIIDKVLDYEYNPYLF